MIWRSKLFIFYGLCHNKQSNRREIRMSSIWGIYYTPSGWRIGTVRNKWPIFDGTDFRLWFDQLRFVMAGLYFDGDGLFWAIPKSFGRFEGQAITWSWSLFLPVWSFLIDTPYLEAIHENKCRNSNCITAFMSCEFLAYTCIKDKVVSTVSGKYVPWLGDSSWLLIMVSLISFSMTLKGLLIGLFAFTYSLYILCPLIWLGSMLVSLESGMTIWGFIFLSGLIQHQWQFRLDILALLGIIVDWTIFAYTVFFERDEVPR